MNKTRRLKNNHLLTIGILVLFVCLFLSCSTALDETDKGPAPDRLTIEDTQNLWIDSYNLSSSAITELYGDPSTSTLHVNGEEHIYSIENIRVYLATKPFGDITSRIQVYEVTSRGKIFEYGYYENAVGETYSYCIKWIQDGWDYKIQFECIIKNDLNDTVDVAHIDAVSNLWNEKMAAGNLDDFFSSLYDQSIVYNNYIGFEAAKSKYSTWIGGPLRLVTPGAPVMEKVQDDLSILLTEWTAANGGGHAFMVHKKQVDDSWKILVEFD